MEYKESSQWMEAHGLIIEQMPTYWILIKAIHDICSSPVPKEEVVVNEVEF